MLYFIHAEKGFEFCTDSKETVDRYVKGCNFERNRVTVYVFEGLNNSCKERIEYKRNDDGIFEER